MKKIIIYTLIHLFTLSLVAAGINTELYTEASAAGLANESNSKGSWNNIYYLAVETTDVATGSYALRINRSGSYTVSTYSFTTTPGEVYTITGKLKANTLNQQFISMIGFTNVQTNQGLAPTTGWASFTYTAEAQGSTASIRIGASNGGGNSGDYLLLDALSIQQGVPDIPITEDNTPYLAPGLNDENYIVKRTYQDSVTSYEDVTYRRQLMEEIQYFDGLGRPIQQIAVQQSPEHQDIITPITYDPFGRQTKEYLPYPSQETNPGHGSYRNNAIDSTNTYYLNTYSADLNSSAPNPFSETLLENSPMNRVQKQAAPGYDWRMGGGHEIEFGYQNNSATEVCLFKVVFTGNNTEAPTLSGNGSQYYLPGTLTKTVTKDENHDDSSTKLHITEEFKDKQGKVVLKRTYATVNSTVEAHDTYYVYDDFGNLTYVLPPKVDTSNGVSATVLSELCYQYKYDQRNRLVEKKIPGKVEEYMVYNKLDQPVLTQDAYLRAQGKWMYTKYDAFGRVIQTGFYSFTGSRTALITAMDNYYNSGSAKAYEQKSGNSYTNESYPTTNTELLTENYYDTYNFNLNGLTLPATTSLGTQLLSGTGTKGLATGSKVKVLDTPSTGSGQGNWITTITGYDKRRRPVYTQSSNPYLDTEDIAETQLDFIGKAKQVKTQHTKGTNATIEVTENFGYDAAGRVLMHTHSVGSKNELLAQNQYDKLGQLITKNVGNTLSSPLQQVDYGYNIRGWLKEINDVNSLGSDLFAFKIGYNEGSNALYNGNISSTSWRTNNTDNSLKQYSYSYDALNRIISGTDNTGNYNLLGIEYDKMGNIVSLQRQGHINADATLFGTMDNLTYAYDAGNKLQSVQDSGNGTYGFKDGANTTTEYLYDDNGNMIKDDNKGISNITYNHLNLPTQVSMADGTISYIYDAAGVKLKKIVNNTAESSLTSTEYAGNYIYENGNLQFFNTAEGYIEPVISTSGEISSFDYIYRYKDHLDNTRLSYVNIGSISSPVLEIVEESNYYPFGLKHKGYNNTVSSNGDALAQAFKFGGKELTQELGLNTYDFGWRSYDPSIGRFIEFDPLAERREYLTPYNYVQNSPLIKIDPSGLSDYGVDKDGNVTLLKKSDDPDKVYSITHGEDNEIIINDTNDDGNIDSSDSSGDISDRGLLASLSIGKKKGSKDLRYAFSQNSKDVSRLFKFFSDNTRVEWGLNKFKNTSEGSDKSEWFFLGTYQQDDLSPTPQSVISGFKNYTEQILNIHSHPGINFTDSDWGDGVLRSSQGVPYPGAAGDWVKVRRKNSNSKFYIYYPNWNGLYQYTPTNPQIKIMTVDDKDDLNKVVKSSNK